MTTSSKSGKQVDQFVESISVVPKGLGLLADIERGGKRKKTAELVTDDRAGLVVVLNTTESDDRKEKVTRRITHTTEGGWRRIRSGVMEVVGVSKLGMPVEFKTTIRRGDRKTVRKGSFHGEFYMPQQMPVGVFREIERNYPKINERARAKEAAAFFHNQLMGGFNGEKPKIGEPRDLLQHHEFLKHKGSLLYAHYQIILQRLVDDLKGKDLEGIADFKFPEALVPSAKDPRHPFYVLVSSLADEGTIRGLGRTVAAIDSSLMSLPDPGYPEKACDYFEAVKGKVHSFDASDLIAEAERLKKSPSKSSSSSIPLASTNPRYSGLVRIFESAYAYTLVSCSTALDNLKRKYLRDIQKLESSIEKRNLMRTDYKVKDFE